MEFSELKQITDYSLSVIYRLLKSITDSELPVIHCEFKPITDSELPVIHREFKPITDCELGVIHRAKHPEWGTVVYKELKPSVITDASKFVKHTLYFAGHYDSLISKSIETNESEVNG